VDRETESETLATRRRGAKLEDVLLEAAWDELVAVGYAGFAMESVALRAHTSRPVLYRRWSNRWDLALAALQRRMHGNPPPVPDTGNVRDDLVGYLVNVSQYRLEFAVLLSVNLHDYFSEQKLSFAEFRERMLSGRVSSLDAVYERAVQRGEIDRAKLTPRVARLPIDLLRHEFLMRPELVSEATVAEIVDTIFLPLVRR
jgi:AcrR family transcriptional regulator